MNNLGPQVPRRPPLPKQTVGLSSINQRLSQLEQTNSTHMSRVQKSIEMSKKQKESEDLEKINDEINSTLDLEFHKEYNPKTFLNVVSRVVELVEEYSPRAAVVIGFAVVGQFKYSLALNILLDLFTDIAEDFVGTTIQHFWDLKFNHHRDPETKQHIIDIDQRTVHEHVIGGQSDKKRRSGWGRFVCGGKKIAR